MVDFSPSLHTFFNFDAPAGERFKKNFFLASVAEDLKKIFSLNLMRIEIGTNRPHHWRSLRSYLQIP